jgi:hypothetical protein
MRADKNAAAAEKKATKRLKYAKHAKPTAKSNHQ